MAQTRNPSPLSPARSPFGALRGRLRLADVAIGARGYVMRNRSLAGHARKCQTSSDSCAHPWTPTSK